MRPSRAALALLLAAAALASLAAATAHAQPFWFTDGGFSLEPPTQEDAERIPWSGELQFTHTFQEAATVTPGVARFWVEVTEPTVFTGAHVQTPPPVVVSSNQCSFYARFDAGNWWYWYCYNFLPVDIVEPGIYEIVMDNWGALTPSEVQPGDTWRVSIRAGNIYPSNSLHFLHSGLEAPSNVIVDGAREPLPEPKEEPVANEDSTAEGQESEQEKEEEQEKEQESQGPEESPTPTPAQEPQETQAPPQQTQPEEPNSAASAEASAAGVLGPAALLVVAALLRRR